MLAQFRLPPNYIFYPAQFWSHKNHMRILRAILHLKQKYNLRLPVVFTGSDQGNESYIRQLVQTLQLDNQVFFLCHVSRPALRALYQNAFGLCYPSFLGPVRAIRASRFLPHNVKRSLLPMFLQRMEMFPKALDSLEVRSMLREISSEPEVALGSRLL